MIVKTIKYKDYNGNEQTEKMYFNLTQVEGIQLGIEKGLTKKMATIEELSKKREEDLTEEDNISIIQLFQLILVESYGVKSEDGKRFIKSQQLKEEFMQSPAYNALFLELLQKPDEAIRFMKGVSDN